MTIHDCPDCGLTHSIPETGESEAVRITRINRDADIEIARLQRSEVKLEAEAQVEAVEAAGGTEVEVAAIEAESGVEAAEAVAEALAPEPEPEQVVVPVAAASDDEGDEEVASPPEVEPMATEKKSKGWWDGYR